MTLFEVSAADVRRLWPVDPIVADFADISEKIIAAMVGAEPTCFVGFIPLDGGAYMWMETLPGTFKHPRSTVRHAKDLIQKALAVYPKIVGHCREASSIRWLKSLGAEFTTNTSPAHFEIRR